MFVSWWGSTRASAASDAHPGDATFANTAHTTDLVDALASEAGRVQVAPFYVDSIGKPGSGADTPRSASLVGSWRRTKGLSMRRCRRWTSRT